jgi:urease accessory protein
MFDETTPPDTMQRARGRAAVALSVSAGRTRLQGLRQEGCAKAFLPRVSGVPEVVFLNTAGGLTGGDRLDYALRLAPGGAATATTQTAERAYAAPDGAAPADLGVTIEVGAGATLDWLPQETILFDRAALRRTTEIALAGDASLLTCEALVLGRAAMGEEVARLDLSDLRRISRDGRPVMVEPVRIGEAVLAGRAAPAGLAGARALATVALVAPGAEDAAGPLRDLPWPEGVRAAVSGWDGRCLLRLMAGDGWPLRLALAAALRHLRGQGGRRGRSDGALPRVWQI